MNRIPREPLIGGKNINLGPKQQLLRGNGVTIGEGSREEDDSLDLFSRIRQNKLVSSRDVIDSQNERRGGGSPALARRRMDDLLSADSGKHDYDWLLTPPGTPLISPSRSSDYQPSKVAPRSNSNIRSAAIAKTSRFSGPQTENSHSVRPARSSSTTRPSISTTRSSSSFFNTNNRTSVLNTSSASITSRPASSSSRPTTPGSRTASISTSRTAPVSTSRSMPIRSSTPTKSRISLTAPVDKPRPLQNSRPVTPASRPQTPSTLNSRSNCPPTRSNSRPLTPTRRTPSMSANQSTSFNRAAVLSNQIAGSASRPSSPGPRTQAPKKPLALPDFPLDCPPNLRTKLPERALSAGRQRPGLALTVRSNLNPGTTMQASSNRRKASPVVARGRLQENASNVRLNTSASELRPNNNKPVGTEAAAHRQVKPGSPAECTGFGRTISKSSMDMALKHMDIRQSINSIRGASLIPQSIRSISLRGQSGRSSDPSVATFNRLVSHADDSGMSDTITSDNDSTTGASIILGD